MILNKFYTLINTVTTHEFPGIVSTACDVGQFVHTRISEVVRTYFIFIELMRPHVFCAFKMRFDVA